MKRSVPFFSQNLTEAQQIVCEYTRSKVQYITNDYARHLQSAPVGEPNAENEKSLLLKLQFSQA